MDDFLMATGMATGMDDETGKPVPRVMMVTTGTESTIADEFVMAVVLDPDTGKPMPKVQVVGGGSGGGQTVDLTPITNRLTAVEGVNTTQTTNIKNLTSRISTVETSNSSQGVEIEATKDRVTLLEEIVDALETQILDLITRIEALETPTP